MNQLTMLNGAIGVSRSDLITGPLPPVIFRNVASASRQGGVKGNDPATFLLCNPIFERDDSPNIADSDR